MIFHSLNKEFQHKYYLLWENTELANDDGKIMQILHWQQIMYVLQNSLDCYKQG